MSSIWEPYYKPHVYINGERLPEGRGATGLSPIASFRIKWGATDWYSNVEPAELTLSLIDPLGEFLDFTTEKNIPIRITRDDIYDGVDSHTVFTGTVIAAESELGKIQRADGSIVQTWITTLTARDPLQHLADNRTHGPRYYPRPGPGEGPDWHFGPCTMRERKNDLDARSPVGIDWEPVNALDWLDDEPIMVILPIPGYETQQNVSSLTVLRNTARISNPMNRPYYDPQRQLIDFIKPPTAGATLRVNNGNITSTSTDLGRTLDGHHFRPINGISASTEASEQVSHIELVQRACIPIGIQNNNPSRQTDESSTVRQAVAAPSRMTVSLDTDFGRGYDMSPTWDYTFALTAWGTYGKQTTGPLKWRLTDDLIWPDAPEYAELFLNPFPPMSVNSPITFSLVNSLTNWAPGTGSFSVVGGEISYTPEGWDVTINPAAVYETDLTFTLGMLTSTVQLGSLPENRIVADLTKTNLN